MNGIPGGHVMYPNIELVESEIGHYKACISRSGLFQNSCVPRIIGPCLSYDIIECDPIFIG